MKGHLMSSHDMRDFCIYCSKTLDKRSWKSEFYKGHHYKINECNCGKTTRIKVDFLGSGHDSWCRPEKKPGRLEKKVEVMEKIIVVT